MVIHTDSKAALHVIQQASPADNVRLTTTILSQIQSLASHGKRVRLNWIPSHVGLQGNETADAAARAATRSPAVTSDVAVSRKQVKTLIKRAATRRTEHQHREAERRKYQAAWYARTTSYQPLDHSVQRLRAEEVVLQRLRLGYCTRDELREDFQSQQCGHCGHPARRPLIHYLLHCPATTRLRRYTHRTPQDRQDSEEARAALTVRHAQQDMKILLEVALASPPPL